eukprot:2157474-Rhodomonas_salina.2
MREGNDPSAVLARVGHGRHPGRQNPTMRKLHHKSKSPSCCALSLNRCVALAQVAPNRSELVLAIMCYAMPGADIACAKPLGARSCCLSLRVRARTSTQVATSTRLPMCSGEDTSSEGT